MVLMISVFQMKIKGQFWNSYERS